MKISIMWPPELVITESLFRHYVGVAEVAGYLKNNSKLIKHHQIMVTIHDCAVKVYTALNMAEIAYNNSLVALYVNMNNIVEAIETIKFLKSVNPSLTLVVYGEAAACNPLVFSKCDQVDYVISNGQHEFAIEVILARILDDVQFVQKLNYTLEGKVITVLDRLAETDWGITDFDMIPYQEYLNLSNGEIHLLVNKGCPFNCDFCNERLVSSNTLYYRSLEQVVDFMCKDYDDKIKSIYLDASTFTYNKEWVLSLCKAIQEKSKVLPWKTCTRLDCLDEELIEAMAKSGCERISIGVESFDIDIQTRNKKVVSVNRLKWFAECCHKHGIKPRALLIIGLEGQTQSDLIEANNICNELKIDARFRVLQDYSAFISCVDLSELDVIKLDRWNTWNPFIDFSIERLRQIEFPIEKICNNYV